MEDGRKVNFDLVQKSVWEISHEKKNGQTSEISGACVDIVLKLLDVSEFVGFMPEILYPQLLAQDPKAKL
jgi:hypothetical protein